MRVAGCGVRGAGCGVQGIGDKVKGIRRTAFDKRKMVAGGVVY